MNHKPETGFDEGGFAGVKPELLAPAGNLAKLKTAFLYGADAAYLGGTRFGLRAQADNFTPEEMREAVRLAELLGKKVYVTVNIVARNQDLAAIVPYVRQLAGIDVHGVIVSDIGAFLLIREAVPELPVHVSTQANNLNWRTVKFWLDQGAARVNLARELSLEEIAEIHARLSETLGEAYTARSMPVLEAFVHGAMCMAFSGRCLLSDYLAGRSSNRGDCAQPCRWKYRLEEEKRPGQYMPVSEDENGTFLFNSKDLCMLDHLPELLRCGVRSLKIEGRMKSEFYTAVTVHAYRIALDACLADPAAYARNEALRKELLEELCTVSHRDFSTGFYLGGRGEQIYSSSSYIREADFIGVAERCDPVPAARAADLQEGTEKDDPAGRPGKLQGESPAPSSFCTVLRLRGAFALRDELEFVLPGRDKVERLTVTEMENEDGERIDRAANAMMAVRLTTPFFVPAGCLVRRRKPRA